MLTGQQCFTAALLGQVPDLSLADPIISVPCAPGSSRMQSSQADQNGMNFKLEMAQAGFEPATLGL